MFKTQWLTSLFAILLLNGLATHGLGAQEPTFVIKRVGALEWQSAPEFPGIEFAFLEGNPADPGLYVLRARFAPGASSTPHFHSSDRLVTVISGVWHAGVDESGDMAQTTPLYPGDFMKHPAGAIHYDGAKNVETIVEIRGIGPVQTTRIAQPD